MKQLNYSHKSLSFKFLLLFFVSLLIKNNCNSQVNQQSGSATLSLPMFNWQDDKSRLNAVVALDYNSGSGLKVDDVASNVGQGWNLLAGGVITRMQVGEPDDQIPRHVNDVTKYPAGYLYAQNDPSLGCLKAITNYPIYGEKNRLYKQHNIVAEDKELDYFSFTFNGRSGVFVLDKNSYDNITNTFKGVSIGDSKLKISFTRNESAAGWGFRTSIRTFSIQDENGLIYRFGNINNTEVGNGYLGRTKVLKNNYCDQNLLQSLTQPDFENGGVYHESAFDDNTLIKNPYIVDGWYLAQIEDALTHRKIFFNYAVRNINAASGIGIAHYFSNKSYVILSHKISMTMTPEISSIVFPDGHNVSFNYGNARIDLIGDEALSSVDIIYKGRYLSKYQLNTSYFILNRYGMPVSDYQKRVARLCLLSVKKYGVDLKASDPPYNFDYYIGSNNSDDFVPPPFFYAKDIWGYYNGDYSRNSFNSPVSLKTTVSNLSYPDLKGLCFLRNGSNNIVFNPKAGYAKNGLLKQIIYPTGGAVTYEYSQNTGILNGQNTNVGGVQVSGMKITDGGYSNDCNNRVVTNYKYRLEDSTKSSLWGIETPVNFTILKSHYEPESKYYYYKFPFGSCAYRYLYPGILSKEQSVSVSNGQKIMVSVSKILNIVSTITSIMNIANVIGGATGVLAWASIVIDIIGGLTEILLTCVLSQVKDDVTTIYYNSDLNAVNSLPSQFKRVEVIQNTGGAGKTVNVFTSPDDYAIWELTNPIYSMKQRYAYWAYGLPRLTTIHDINGKKVRETEYLYDYSNARRNFIEPKTNKTFYPSCKSQVKKSFSQNNTSWENPDLASFVKDMTSQKDVLEAEIYYISTGRIELKEKSDRVYKMNDQSQYVETKTSYGYNSSNYMVNSVTTTQSNGDVNIISIKYNIDFYDPTTLNKLTDNNILSTVVKETSDLIKSGNSYSYLNEKVTEYVTLANGDIKPLKRLEQRFTQPQPIYSVALYQGPGNSSNPPYKEIQSFTYDAKGNLIGMKDEGNHIVSNIYDYNDKYVVASVINADPVIDKPAYTSFETAGYYGGWTLNGSGNAIGTSSVTGVNSFGLSSTNSLSASLNSAKPYKLSLWANNSSVRVNGNAGTVKSTQVINGFTYYEFDISSGTSGVVVSATANIDELRLYPNTARMRTITYDPLIGKTGECDENNRITYYEYDELGRMRFIRDENKHIVKMYEYNYKKQTGCPVTYSNLAVSEIFTKNNCSAGYIGSDIIYTVPAGKYTSSISQDDVDQKVQNELNTYGQTYANNNQNNPNTTGVGTCIKLYYSTPQSQSFTKQNCPPGSIGNTITYSVPANKYFSTIDTATANQMARDEIKANGQAFANNDASVGCLLNTDAVWEADETGSVRCHKDANGNFTGHQEVYMTDVNPNSSTRNTQQWKDAGPNEATCPPTKGSAPVLTGTGYQTASGSGVITGQPGTTISITVTLNSSDAGANLTGNAGGNIQLSGSGTKSITNTVTIPDVGYISWKLTLSGTLSSGDYISSSISY